MSYLVVSFIWMLALIFTATSPKPTYGEFTLAVEILEAWVSLLYLAMYAKEKK